MNNKTILGTVVLLVILFGLYLVTDAIRRVAPEPEPEPEQVFCTMDAKMCPDGSYVGRTGPRCEFALCPSEALCEGGACPSTTGTTPQNY